MTNARENSVKQLSEMYNVVTGVALTLAIVNIVDSDAPLIPIKSGLAAINFLTFAAVIVPFHQGAVRHLYATYVEGGGSSRTCAAHLLWISLSYLRKGACCRAPRVDREG